MFPPPSPLITLQVYNYTQGVGCVPVERMCQRFEAHTGSDLFIPTYLKGHASKDNWEKPWGRSERGKNTSHNRSNLMDQTGPAHNALTEGRQKGNTDI